MSLNPELRPIDHNNISNPPVTICKFKANGLRIEERKAKNSALARISLTPLKKLVSRIVIASSRASKKKKAALDEKKNKFLASNQTTTAPLAFETHDGAVLDGTLIFADETQKKEFESGRNTSHQKWIIITLGNGEFYERNLDFAREYGKESGANVLVFNYRGVNHSTGSVSDAKDLVTDLNTCVEFLRIGKGIPDQNIVIHGSSLGGGVGAQVASLYKDIALVNYHSFSSLSQVVKHRIPIIGGVVAKVLRRMGWELDTLSVWDGIKNKIIVFHREDKVIPYKEASLYKALKNRINGNSEVQKPLHIKQTKRVVIVKEYLGWGYSNRLLMGKDEEFAEAFQKREVEKILIEANSYCTIDDGLLITYITEQLRNTPLSFQFIHNYEDRVPEDLTANEAIELTKRKFEEEIANIDQFVEENREKLGGEMTKEFTSLRKQFQYFIKYRLEKLDPESIPSKFKILEAHNYSPNYDHENWKEIAALVRRVLHP